MLNFSSADVLDYQISFKPLKNKLRDILPSEAINYIALYIPLTSNTVKILETSSPFNVINIEEDKIDYFINLKKINDIRYLNKFFEAVNQKLNKEGIFVGRAETIDQRRKKILAKYPPVISYPLYALDFIFKRVFPKAKLTKRLYFFLTNAQNRALSFSEIMGRLVSCGFSIIDFKEINNQLYFTVKKTSMPSYDMNPSYGPVFKMRRIGINGKTIQVYKLRTMHPYSEYLQSYIYQLNKLEEGGKFKDDFRVTGWGKLFRKLWIDELPMILNWIKGDLKLVGIRPLSQHYLSLYNEDLKERRIKYKPGLVPPFYVDMPKTLEEIMESEKRYLDAYDKNPFVTDINYFFKAFYNIFINKVRSA